MHTTYSPVPFEAKYVAETGIFEGYASVFNVTDQVNDRILQGAFIKSLNKAQGENRLPPLLWQHDMSTPIGVWREMREDDYGLYVRGELFINDVPKAREAYALMRNGGLSGLSIGYKVRESTRERASGTRILTDIDLLEISVVTMPANDSARIMRVKSAFAAGDVPSVRDFEAFLRDAGLSNKQAKGMIAHGYKSLNPLPRDVASNLLPRDAAEDADGVDQLYALADAIRSLT